MLTLTSLLDLLKKTKQLLLQASKTYPSPHRNTMPLKAAAACLLLPAAPCCCLLLVQLLVAAAAAVVLLWCCCNQTASKARNKQPNTLFETSETAKQHLISSPKHSKGTPKKLKLCRCLLLPPTPTCGPHKQQKHLPTAGCSATATCERNHSQ